MERETPQALFNELISLIQFTESNKISVEDWKILPQLWEIHTCGNRTPSELPTHKLQK